MMDFLRRSRARLLAVAGLATVGGAATAYAVVTQPFMASPHLVLAESTVATVPSEPSAQQLAMSPQVHKPLQAMSTTDIDRFLQGLPADPVARIERASAQALGTPYRLGPLGEGEGAPYDSKPLIDFKAVDCVTFCEQTLALALSSSYQETVETLQKIRYKNGEIKMECRNHYTLADWTVNNQWLMQDMTATLPGHQWLTRTISHQKLFAAQHFEGIQVREPDRQIKAAYIPENQLMAVLPHLKSGDMAVLIQDHEGIFAAHTGFMIQKSGQWVFRNATSIGSKQVVDTPFEVLVDSLKKSKRLIGMSFIRPRAEAFRAVSVSR